MIRLQLRRFAAHPSIFADLRISDEQVERFYNMQHPFRQHFSEIRRDKRSHSACVKIGEGWNLAKASSFYQAWPYHAKRFGCQSVKGRVRFEEKPATEHSMAFEREL